MGGADIAGLDSPHDRHGGAPTAAKPERWTAQWKELYAEVITTGLCTGCAGCVITCPHDVIGYEHEEGKYKPVPPRGGARPRQLHPRREGLHHLHPGLPAVPRVGDQADDAPVRPGARARRDGRHLAPAAADPGDRRHRAHAWARTAASSSAMSIWLLRARLHRRRAWSSGVEDDDAVEGQAGRGHDQRRGARHRRQPLHVLAPTRWP